MNLATVPPRAERAAQRREPLGHSARPISTYKSRRCAPRTRLRGRSQFSAKNSSAPWRLIESSPWGGRSPEEGGRAAPKGHARERGEGRSSRPDESAGQIRRRLNRKGSSQALQLRDTWSGSAARLARASRRARQTAHEGEPRRPLPARQSVGWWLSSLRRGR
jgi:hypothetical protein